MNVNKQIPNRSSQIPDAERMPGAESRAPVTGEFVRVDGDVYYRIGHNENMPGFFMSLSSSSDHWMFVSSRGAVTAGRKNPDSAYFPYYSADKIADLQHCTGPKTIFRVSEAQGGTKIWEPFSMLLPTDSCSQSIYKNTTGNKLIFEEINHDLNLRFRYRWTFGHRFGFIRSCQLENISGKPLAITMLDGFENILPAGLNDNFQLRYSNLADAYKKNELIAATGLGIYYLSSIPSDRAEPSEGLRANTAWHYGFNGGGFSDGGFSGGASGNGLSDGASGCKVLLSSAQVERFRRTGVVEQETDVRAHRGAYLISRSLQITANQSACWTIVGNTGLDTTDVINLSHLLETDTDVAALVEQDVRNCELRLDSIIASADGCQSGADPLTVSRHRANVLFNAMRGGIPADGYFVDTADFRAHVRQCNRESAERHAELLNADFGASDGVGITSSELIGELEATADADLIRIGREYLPLTFSRRHGDPTRPWNRFSIEAFADNGSRSIDYQGNWRDIFQNWEALLVSYPRFAGSMVFRFLNASTADGYNPYRLTKDGFEWEAPDADDPWANIGYWGDHQIVYLLKLLEWSHKFDPESLDQSLAKSICTYAEVPYRIRGYAEILDNPKETIDYDRELESRIASRVERIGSDGKLLQDADDRVLHVTTAEKLILPALIKMTNFVPGGGIWLNTQRPEWNDANNSLVGNGLSMVTVCYLRRFFVFMRNWFSENKFNSFPVSTEVATLLERVYEVLDSQRGQIANCSSATRKSIVDGISSAGSVHREGLYRDGLSGEKIELTAARCVEFFDVCLEYLEQTIRENRRSDGLYHSYNLLSLETAPGSDPDSVDEITGMSVEPLFEMLEGQVAVLSSGLLEPRECVAVLTALKASPIYRKDQNSYMLYPDRDLPRFTEKNRVPADLLRSSELARKIVDSPSSILRRDLNSGLHFNGDFRNVNDLDAALDELAADPELSELIAREREQLRSTFEQTFNHRQFVGRSGTFFGYEGLGSIYWHMVSKLCLAVQECYLSANRESADIQVRDQLHSFYREIRDGIALKKQPEVYGAFPTDPYSHTPAHAGAQQPGMTGQVKEDILSRTGEIGIRIEDGIVHFDPCLFESSELLIEPGQLDYVDVSGTPSTIEVPEGAFAFTICQVPVIYHLGDIRKVEVVLDGSPRARESECCLTVEESQSLFDRDGRITRIDFYF